MENKCIGKIDRCVLFCARCFVQCCSFEAGSGGEIEILELNSSLERFPAPIEYLNRIYFKSLKERPCGAVHVRLLPLVKLTSKLNFAHFYYLTKRQVHSIKLTEFNSGAEPDNQPTRKSLCFAIPK